MANDELYHYGRKGMKWGKNIFGKDSITSKLGSAAKAVSSYRQTEANAKRDLLKRITRDSIMLDRHTGRNTRTYSDPIMADIMSINPKYRDSVASSLKNKINQANETFGKNSNWGSVNYKESLDYKVDRGKRFLNVALKSMGKKSIFATAISDTADYGMKFMRSKYVTQGILNNRHLWYGYELENGGASSWNKNPESKYENWHLWKL